MISLKVLIEKPDKQRRNSLEINQRRQNGLDAFSIGQLQVR